MSNGALSVMFWSMCSGALLMVAAFQIWPARGTPSLAWVLFMAGVTFLVAVVLASDLEERQDE